MITYAEMSKIIILICKVTLMFSLGTSRDIEALAALIIGASSTTYSYHTIWILKPVEQYSSHYWYYKLKWVLSNLQGHSFMRKGLILCNSLLSCLCKVIVHITGTIYHNL